MNRAALVIVLTSCAVAASGAEPIGRLIWSAETTEKQSCRLWRAFEIPADAPVQAATLRIHADNGFLAMLDGRELGVGSDFRFTTEYDIGDVLTPGRHVLAIRGFNEEGPAGVAVALRVETAAGEPLIVVSDSSWRVVPAAEAGWERRHQPAAHWPHAVEVGAIGTSYWQTLPTQLFKVIVPSPTPTPIWQRGWFQGLVAATAAAAVVASLVMATRLAAQARATQLLDRERTRIARDIHDELGAGITQLILEGEVARTELDQASESHERIVSLCGHARGLAAALDELVWAVNPRRDTVHDFTAFAGKYVRRFLEPTSMRCRIDVDPDLPDAVFALPIRRTLLLAVKEAVTNAVRHSGASELHFRAFRTPQSFIVAIEDDGRGFDLATARTAGNGLAHLGDRLREIGGTTRIVTAPGAGCRIALEVPWPS